MNEPEKQIDPLNDLLFKKMLSSEDQKAILQGFIRDFFNIDAALNEILLVTPYSIKTYKELLQNKLNNSKDPDDTAAIVSVMRETRRDI